MNEPSGSNEANPGRLYWLDALRGFAAIAVMFSHYIWTPLGDQEGILHYLISPGELGVAIFFCVSGVLIPLSVKRVYGLGVVGFAITRIFRLYPLYWICLLLSFLITPVALSRLLLNGTMLQRFAGSQDMVSVFWTLQVEIVFYVLVAMIILLSARSRYHAFFLAGIISLCCVVACAVVRHFIGLKAPLALFVGLTVMFTIATYFENTVLREKNPKLFQLYFTSVLVLLPAAWFVAYDRNWGSNEVPFLSALTMVTSYGLAVTIFFASSHYRKRIPSILVHIGEISYPLYLFHEPIHKFFSDKIEIYVGFWSASIVSAVATCVLAAMIHQLIELPMIGIGKRLSRPWRQNPRLPDSALEAHA